ncbi:hypothetical protein BDZ91DRAFT_791239 [Kalaharituber pfeilii]|nr:hypothetical protein BDZ91DRAFT_791239 [Kalaharituber pfeilii]
MFETTGSRSQTAPTGSSSSHMLVKSSVELEQFHANLSSEEAERFAYLQARQTAQLIRQFENRQALQNIPECLPPTPAPRSHTLKRLRTANEQALIRLEQRTANTTENNTLYPKNKRQRKTEAASSAKATGSVARTDKRVMSERSWRKRLSSDEVREPQAESACPERFRESGGDTSGEWPDCPHILKISHVGPSQLTTNGSKSAFSTAGYNIAELEVDDLLINPTEEVPVYNAELPATPVPVELAGDCERTGAMHDEMVQVRTTEI